MLTSKVFKFDVRREVQAIRCDRCEATVPRFALEVCARGQDVDAAVLSAMGVPAEQLNGTAGWVHLEVSSVGFDFCAKCQPAALAALKEVATSWRQQ